jgi:CRISPR/Cas system CSM-associated protein Csm3 (group 7 of RAMP superfamily)
MSYLRVWIELTLETTSDMHIGDGTEEALGSRGKTVRAHRFGVKPNDIEDDKEQKSAQYARVYRDHAANPLKPYIPGSTLRGLLRRLAKDSPELTFLFGSERQADSLSAGALVVEDGVWQSTANTNSDHLPFYESTCDSFIRHATAIDAITGAVAGGQLFSYELVPSGAQFKATLRIEAPAALNGQLITGAHVNALRHVLAQLDGASFLSALGAGTGQGMGRIKVTNPSFTAVSAADFATWVANVSDAKPSQTPMTPERDARSQTLNDDIAAATAPPKTVDSHTLTLNFISPLMCSDPNRKRTALQGLSSRNETEKKIKKAKEDHHATFPAQAFLRDASGNPIIPARSLRGAARARARKIVATMALQQPNMDIPKALNVADRLIDELFGTQAKRSLVQFTDAKAAVATSSKIQMQTFNAIDRFTGGVADGKLYSAEWADNPTLHTELSFRKPLEPWQKGLLTLLARDAAEGDLALGWGKAKGFGRFLLESAHMPTFGPAIESKWLDAVRALEGEINKKINGLPAQEQARHG